MVKRKVTGRCVVCGKETDVRLLSDNFTFTVPVGVCGNCERRDKPKG